MFAHICMYVKIIWGQICHYCSTHRQIIIWATHILETFHVENNCRDMTMSPEIWELKLLGVEFQLLGFEGEVGVSCVS